MENSELIGSQWRYVLQMLPDDLERTVRTKLAIQRGREIWTASDLLRLVLAYSVCDFSLRQTAVWASMIGLAELSDVAVLNRLAKASDWMNYLIVRWLRDHGLTTDAPATRVRIIDATVVCEPGSKGTDWRLHLGLDLSQERITGLELTSPEGGETLLRHQLGPGEIILGDRGYGQRGGVAYALEHGNEVVVRISEQNFPLKTLAGGAVDVLACSRLLSEGEMADWPVQFEHHRRLYPMRLIVMHKTAAAAEKEQRRIHHEARSKKRELHPRSLERAKFITLITNLPPERFDARQVLELYRLRWQIEMAFKRLKGLLHLDKLRAKNPQLASTYLYGKLLGALLLDELYAQAESFFPWGFALFDTAAKPLEDLVCAPGGPAGPD